MSQNFVIDIVVFSFLRNLMEKQHVKLTLNLMNLVMPSADGL
jgi:hypothetical protein